MAGRLDEAVEAVIVAQVLILSEVKIFDHLFLAHPGVNRPATGHQLFQPDVLREVVARRKIALEGPVDPISVPAAAEGLL